MQKTVSNRSLQSSSKGFEYMAKQILVVAAQSTLSIIHLGAGDKNGVHIVLCILGFVDSRVLSTYMYMVVNLSLM